MNNNFTINNTMKQQFTTEARNPRNPTEKSRKMTNNLIFRVFFRDFRVSVVNSVLL
jgi:hypothetical protein